MGTDTQGFIQQFCLADSEILDVFNLPLVRGNRRTALTTHNGLLVTESVARKYFGESDPIGKVVRAENWYEGDYTITGVLKDLPETSLLQFDFLASTLPDWHENHWLRKTWEQWNSGATQVYVVLEATTQPKNIEQQLLSLVPRYAGEAVRGKIQHHLQPIVRAHLFAGQDYGGSLKGKGDIRRLYVVAILGAFILLLAGINFINLSTARSTMRAKEVGMRKVVGAHRGQIIGQFLGESFLLTAFAHLFAVLMVYLSLPWMSSYMGIPLSLKQAGFWLLLILPGSVLIIGFLAGSCPAFLISRFRPIAALKGELVTGGTSLRRGLILFQFSISVLLIAGTFVVFSQWQFMVGKDPGYDKENVVILPIFKADESLKWSRSQEVRQRFLRHPNILSACVTNDTPVGGGGYEGVRPEGETRDWQVRAFDLDEDVLKVFGIELIHGRDYSWDRDQRDFRWDSDHFVPIILNETAVKTFGWEDPIGKTFEWRGWRKDGKVIGVVKDFHYRSLREEIKPLLLRFHSGQQYLSLRLGSKGLAETMAFIQETWTDFAPNRSFQYEFLDEKLEAIGLQIMILNFIGLKSSVLGKNSTHFFRFNT